MKRIRSISFRLSAIFFSFFFLTIVLGFFAIGRLSDFNFVSSDLSRVWLPKTRFLGDLNNYTSDLRAAEASRLLAANLADAEKDLVELDQTILKVRHNYEQMPRDAAERDLFNDFSQKWSKYREIVDQESMLLHSDHTTDATAVYRTTSRVAYDAASDALGQLTERNVAYAHAATNRVNEAYRQARWLISGAMLFAAMLIAAALLFMKRSISRPLLHLAGVMDRLAVNDTDIDIQGTKRPDEIGEMARAALVFRANAIGLMQTQHGLAREASELAEKLANEKNMAQSQRNFVSMVSHEFRTPLTIVDAAAQRLIKMKDRLLPDQLAERAGRIRRAVFRMTNLMDNLLDASRLMEIDGNLDFDPAIIDLRPLLREVCQLHREITPGANIVENFDVLPSRVNGDVKLLLQMFSNLLSNAVKYSPAGSQIRVNGSTESEQLIVDIEDQGIGIPEKDVGTIFDRYSRGSNVSGIVGTGIGLYIVRSIAELHGGLVVLESKEGRGSHFTVKLPTIPPHLIRAKPSSEELILSPEHQTVEPPSTFRTAEQS